MSSSSTRLITVLSIEPPSAMELEEEDKILEEVESIEHRAREDPATSRNGSGDGDSTPEEPCVLSSTASIFIAEDVPTLPQRSRRVMLRETTQHQQTFHSTSTALVEDEIPSHYKVTSDQDSSEVYQVLDWFKEVLAQAGKDGKMSLKDLKNVARNCEVTNSFDFVKGAPLQCNLFLGLC